MKPNASLKSLNTNFRVMASRPFTSLQPESFASAALRASPVSFCAMTGPHKLGDRKLNRRTTDLPPRHGRDIIIWAADDYSPDPEDVNAQANAREFEPLAVGGHERMSLVLRSGPPGAFAPAPI